MTEDETPLTDLQMALSQTVDFARALPKESVSPEFAGLVTVYLAQVAEAVGKARSVSSVRVGDPDG